jgi:hypothetical protein
MTTEQIRETLRLYDRIRENAGNLAVTIRDCCPDSREKSRAIELLQEAVMWANSSIGARTAAA